MPEHYTRDTISCTVWCAKCGRMTEHRVDDRRRGPCMGCLAKPIEPQKPVQEDRQGSLFQ